MMHATICYIGFPVVIVTLCPPVECNQCFPNPLPLTTERINHYCFRVFLIEKFSSHQLGLASVALPPLVCSLPSFLSLPFPQNSHHATVQGVQLMKSTAQLFWQKERERSGQIFKAGLVRSVCGLQWRAFSCDPSGFVHTAIMENVINCHQKMVSIPWVLMVG